MAGIALTPDECFRVTEVKRGTSCGKAESVELVCENICAVPLDKQACLEKTDGKWWCGASFAVKPGEQACGGTWTCAGTGRYKIWGRANSRVPFPDASGTFRTDNGKTYSVASGENQEMACRRAQSATGGTDPCECEAADKSGQNFRCRVASAVPATVNPSAVQPFKPGHFLPPPAEPGPGERVEEPLWTAVGDSRDASCARLRQLADSADAACECAQKGRVWVCTARVPEFARIPDDADTLRKENRRRLLEKHKARCKQYPEQCKMESGVRG